MEKKNWVISLTGMQSSTQGYTLKNRLYEFNSVIREEAIGRASLVFMEENPDCPIHLIVQLELKTSEQGDAV